MSPYLLLYFYVLFATGVSCYAKKSAAKCIYAFTMMMLFAFLALRYGQGTDYFTYESRYNYFQSVPNANRLMQVIAIDHMEPLWIFFAWCLGKANIDFQFFIIMLSIFEFYAICRYIKFYCPQNQMWAVLVMFPTLYLSYLYSGLRQALTICAFMGFLLPYLEQKKILRYCVCTAILMLVHTAAVAFFIVPILIKFKTGTLQLAIVIALAVGCALLCFPQVTALIPYGKESKVSLLAVLERFVMFGFVTYLYYKKPQMNRPIDKLFYKIYVISIITYCFFIFSPTTASRLSFPMRTVEYALLAHCISKLRNMRQIIFPVILLLNIVMTCKNLDSYLWQGKYRDDVKFWNYPYVSIFNKEDIFKYRRTRFNLQ